MSSKDDKILVATETFATEVDGEPVVIHRGITRVRAGHPLAKANADRFEEADTGVHFDVEQATAAPGEGRGGRRRGHTRPSEVRDPSGISADETGPDGSKAGATPPLHDDNPKE